MIGTHWLYNRYSPIERLVQIFDGYKCPRCNTRGFISFEWVRASEFEGAPPPPPPIAGTFGVQAEPAYDPSSEQEKSDAGRDKPEK